MRGNPFVLTVLLCFSLALQGRSQAADSVKVFTIDEYMVQIAVHHPLAQQANQMSEQARQEIRLARGVFDPVAASKYYNKELYGKNYFTLWDNVLKVPLWIGELKAGYERNSGVNVNGENITPPDGLGYLGISVPIAQGLLIDERRAALRQAQEAQALQEAERVKIINKLLFEAAKAYWDWAYSHQRWQQLEQSYNLATIRWNAIKERVTQGDLAAIDAVEAETEALNRLVMLKQARIETINAALRASNYMWGENSTPLEIPEQVVPSLAGTQIEPVSLAELQALVASAQQNHPDIAKLRVKLRQLDIERRFGQNKLLPKLTLDYSIIGPGGSMGSQWLEERYVTDNYKLGASFSFPLFLRNERAKLQLTRLKINATNFELTQTNRENMNQIEAAYNERQLLEEQIVLQEQVVANANRLLAGELQRFEIGESSVFLVNTRESNFLSQQIKLYELRAKYGKAKYQLQWAAGNLR